MISFQVKIFWWKKEVYNWWICSPISKPYYVIKTFCFLQWKAREIACHLDDCLRVLGQAHHAEPREKGFLVPKEPRNELISRQWQTMPCGWKWRKD